MTHEPVDAAGLERHVCVGHVSPGTAHLTDAGQLEEPEHGRAVNRQGHARELHTIGNRARRALEPVESARHRLPQCADDDEEQARGPGVDRSLECRRRMTLDQSLGAGTGEQAVVQGKKRKQPDIHRNRRSGRAPGRARIEAVQVGVGAPQQGGEEGDGAAHGDDEGPGRSAGACGGHGTRNYYRDMASAAPRVAITGIGVVSPFGVGRERFWRHVSRGCSATRAITEFDASAFPCRVAAPVPDVSIDDAVIVERATAARRRSRRSRRSRAGTRKRR